MYQHQRRQAVAILKGADDFTLVIMTQRNEEISYPNAFHFGFMLGSEEEVKNLYHSLKNEGINVGDALGNIRDSFGFYFNFDNLMLEVEHYRK